MPSNISSFDFIECHICKGLGSPFYNYKMLGSNPLAENQGGFFCHPYHPLFRTTLSNINIWVLLVVRRILALQVQRFWMHQLTRELAFA